MLMDRTYNADLMSGRKVREDVAEALAPVPLSEQRVHDLLLVLSEAFTNIVRHGSPSANRIRVGVQRTGDGLSLFLEDDAGHFDGFHEAIATASDPAGGPLMEGGIGLGLIAQLVGGIEYGRTGAMNRLSFIEPVPGPRGPLVYVIDDDAVQRALVQGFLSGAYTVRSFGDPSEALGEIVRVPPDLIISDIAMPVMDGLELRRNLQGDERTALIPFVFLTGLRDEAIEERASELEIDDFLEKPISKTRLKITAERVLCRSKRLREMVQSSVDRRITDILKCPLPSRAGSWSVDAMDEPASPGGGDFIMHRAGPGWMTVLLLDVMGHGVPAKIFAFAYAGYVQSLLTDEAMATRPEAVIDALSFRVKQDTRLEETIVTCVAATLRDDGTATVAVGGHPRPLLYREGQAWRPVPATGAMPGLGAAAPQPKTVQLKAGDAILLVTDGLGEALSKEQPENALLGAMNKCGPVDDRFLSNLSGLTAGSDDDRTAILFRYQGEGIQ